MKATKNPKTQEQAAEQTAIDAMAKQLYLIKRANKAKAEELAKFIASVDRDEATFKAGVPFEFTLDEAGSSIKVHGRLVLRNQRNWEDADLVFVKD